jgi:Dyp-type peroxidase family
VLMSLSDRILALSDTPGMSHASTVKSPQRYSPLNLDVLVDSESPEWTTAAALLQGNIVKGYGKEHSALLLFEIKSQRGVRYKVRDLALKYVTPAEAQTRQAAGRNDNVVDRQLYGGLYLSVWGYHALGYSATQLRNAFPDPAGLPDSDNWFLTGMEYQGSLLKDPPRFQWEPCYRDNRIGGALLLASDDFQEVADAAKRASERINDIGRLFQVERGRMLRDSDGHSREHFGFRDGISMPGIFRSSTTPTLPRHLLVPDVLSHQEHAFGSYLVYRKLEQNISGFRRAVAALADVAGVPEQYASAMVLGRFPDGSPLIPPSGETPAHDPGFTDDLLGRRCPFQAHIRKVNPRVGVNGRPKFNPLFRRGIPYGWWTPENGDQPPASGVGLLFLAFQSDIGRQFGVISANWANNKDFLVSGTGTDSLAGRRQGADQHWPGSAGGGKDVRFQIDRFVTVKGGEFLFAPSVAFFRQF